jgi:hypothetical protein
MTILRNLIINVCVICLSFFISTILVGYTIGTTDSSPTRISSTISDILNEGAPPNSFNFAKMIHWKDKTFGFSITFAPTPYGLLSSAKCPEEEDY